MTSFILSMASLLSKNTLYIYCLLLTFASAILVADILSLKCLDNPIMETIETSINILNVLVFLIIFIFCYFIGLIISTKIRAICSSKNTFDKRDYYSLYEIKEMSIIENNKVMYEEYKALLIEKTIHENSRCFLLIAIFAALFDLCPPNSIMRKLTNYPVLFVTIFCIFILFFTYSFLGEENHTGIKKTFKKYSPIGIQD